MIELLILKSPECTRGFFLAVSFYLKSTKVGSSLESYFNEFDPLLIQGVS